MSDTLTALLVKLLRPVEIYHSWNVRRARAKGRYRRPA